MSLAVLLRPSVLASVLAHGAAVALGAWAAAAPSRTPSRAPRDVASIEAATATPPEAVAPDDADAEPLPAAEPDRGLAPDPVEALPALEEVAPEPVELPAEGQGFALDLVAGPGPAVRTRRVTPAPRATAETASFPSKGPARAARWLPSNPAPEYPPIARSRGWQGVVLVRVTVEADGTVAEAALERSSGWPVLDEAAVAAARAWRYEPKVEDGAAVSSTIVQPV